MAIRTIREQGGWARPGLTSEQVWRAVARASFAVLSHVTPAGEPRSSGVVYKASGRRLVVAGAPGWDLVAGGAHPPGDHQLPRDGGCAPGRIAAGTLAAGRAGFPRPRGTT